MSATPPPNIINSAMVLSGSNDGLPILIDTTVAPGTLLHQVDGTKHFIWLWATNNGNDPINLLVYKGSGGSFVLDSYLLIPPGQGKFSIEPGVLLAGSKEVRACATDANKIVVTGFVHKRSGDEGI